MSYGAPAACAVALQDHVEPIQETDRAVLHVPPKACVHVWARTPHAFRGVWYNKSIYSSNQQHQSIKDATGTAKTAAVLYCSECAMAEINMLECKPARAMQLHNRSVGGANVAVLN